MSNVLLVAVGASLEQRISAIPGHRVVTIDREYSADLEGIRRAGESFVPDIIFVGPFVRQELALTYIETVSAAQPHVPIVLIAEPTATLLLKAMRAGARDVVENDVTQAELGALLNKADQGTMQLPSVTYDIGTPAFAGTPRVVVVASPKGGVGKTTISTNLAVGFAKMAPGSVVLVDLDLQFGDVSAVLDLHPPHNLADAFSPAGEDTLTLKTFLVQHPGGFHVLCGADSPVDTEKVTGAEISRLIRQLAGQFRYVVIDTAAGIPEATLSALEEASDVVLMSSMDISCLRALRKEVDLLTELSLMPTNRHVVLNYVDRRSGLTIRDVEAVIGLPVNVVIPRSDDVQIAANRGEPLMLRKKSGPFQKALKTLVGRFQLELKPNKLQPHHRGVDLT